MKSDKMSEKATEREETNGNTALDWEIFDILCREELGLPVSFTFFLSIQFIFSIYSHSFSHLFENLKIRFAEISSTA